MASARKTSDTTSLLAQTVTAPVPVLRTMPGLLVLSWVSVTVEIDGLLLPRFESLASTFDTAVLLTPAGTTPPSSLACTAPDTMVPTLATQGPAPPPGAQVPPPGGVALAVLVTVLPTTAEELRVAVTV